MKKGLFTLIKNEELVPGFHRLTFSGDGSAVTRPGQFAEVEIPGYSPAWATASTSAARGQGPC